MESEELMIQQRLLNPKKYHKGCPGCRIDVQKETSEGYPIRELVFVALLVLCNSLPISSLFPYLYFMVRDFHIAATEDIGYYAGIIGSSFMVGRCLTSVLWGIAADRYGRRPVMIIGVIAIIVFNTLFGLSANFWMATLMRFFLGGFNGLLGPIKAYASEVCKEEHQALALSTVGTMWGIGLIIGPALGGFLAQPADKYPNIFSKSSIFGRFPYFLPCFCITMFSIIILITTFWLPETLHNHELEREHDKDGMETMKIIDKNQIWKNWPAMATIIIYCFSSLCDSAYTEIFSLWAVSAKSYGGLAFTTTDVGTVLAITGFAMLIFQLLVFPKLTNLIGPILITRIPLGILVPLLAVHPWIALLSGSALWIVLCCTSSVKYMLSMAASTGTFLLLNNSVAQHQRGIANGIALTGMSLFKAAGPSGGGALFSWAQKRKDSSFLPGDQIVFFVLAFFTLITASMTFEPFLPRSVGKTFWEQNDEETSDS